MFEGILLSCSAVDWGLGRSDLPFPLYILLVELPVSQGLPEEKRVFFGGKGRVLGTQTGRIVRSSPGQAAEEWEQRESHRCDDCINAGMCRPGGLSA